MKARSASVLSPMPATVQPQEGQEVRPLGTLAGKTIGFLTHIWPNYDLMIEELGKLLREGVKVGATPRVDYRRIPRMNEVSSELDGWVHQLDAAVVGVGA